MVFPFLDSTLGDLGLGLDYLLLFLFQKICITHYSHNPSLKVTMRIQIKLTKCEEIGIFCRNIAEKFILKFAKLFYIKKTRGFMPFSSTICDFYNKKLKFWIRRLVAYFHVTGGTSNTCLARGGTCHPYVRKLISLKN